MPKSAKKHSPKSTTARAMTAKAPAITDREKKNDAGLKASSRHRDASIADRNDGALDAGELDPRFVSVSAVSFANRSSFSRAVLARTA
jgi:hypothetical protein